MATFDRQTLTVVELKSILQFDADAGKFFWLVANSNRIRVGDEAGSLDDRGYVRIRINSKDYWAHRLAMFYTYGAWPGEVDHINGNHSDNRIDNLREVTHSENLFNSKLDCRNTSGVKGVCWHKRAQKWYVQIGSGRSKVTKYFNDLDKAEAFAIDIYEGKSGV